jgi:hypothetical protein
MVGLKGESAGATATPAAAVDATVDVQDMVRHLGRRAGLEAQVSQTLHLLIDEPDGSAGGHDSSRTGRATGASSLSGLGH